MAQVTDSFCASLFYAAVTYVEGVASHYELSFLEVRGELRQHGCVNDSRADFWYRLFWVCQERDPCGGGRGGSYMVGVQCPDGVVKGAELGHVDVVYIGLVHGGGWTNSVRGCVCDAKVGGVCPRVHRCGW